MDRIDEKNWDMIQRFLQAEAEGKTPRFFSSRRTLFGIPSELDRQLEAFAAQNAGSDTDKATDGLRSVSTQVVNGKKVASR